MISLFAKKIIGLDIHDLYAHTVELHSAFGKTVLTAFNRIAIPKGLLVNGETKEPAKFVEILRSLFDTALPRPINLSGARLIVSFPEHKMYHSILDFPVKARTDEISGALPKRMEGILPYPLEELYSDFATQPFQKTDKVKSVLFSAIPKNTAEAYLAILQGLGALPHRFVTDIEALKFALPSMLENRSVIAAEIGAGGITLTLYHKSSPLLTRQITLTVPETAETEETKKIYIDEVAMEISVMKDQASRMASPIQVSHAILLGDMVDITGFIDGLTEKLKEKNIEIAVADPRETIDTGKITFDVGRADSAQIPRAVFFTHAIGFAMTEIQKTKRHSLINLTPDPIKIAFRQERIKKILKAGTMLMAVFSLASALAMGYLFTDTRLKRIAIEREVVPITRIIESTRQKEVKKGITEFNQEVKELKTIQSMLFSYGNTTKKIMSAVSPHVSLTSMAFRDSDLTIELTGQAATRQSLLAAQHALEKLPLIKEVFSPISNFDVKDNIAFAFRLTLDLAKLHPYGAKN